MRRLAASLALLQLLPLPAHLTQGCVLPPPKPLQELPLFSQALFRQACQSVTRAAVQQRWDPANPAQNPAFAEFYVAEWLPNVQVRSWEGETLEAVKAAATAVLVCSGPVLALARGQSALFWPAALSSDPCFHFTLPACSLSTAGWGRGGSQLAERPLG